MDPLLVVMFLLVSLDGLRRVLLFILDPLSILLRASSLPVRHIATTDFRIQRCILAYTKVRIEHKTNIFTSFAKHGGAKRVLNWTPIGVIPHESATHAHTNSAHKHTWDLKRNRRFNVTHQTSHYTTDAIEASLYAIIGITK